MKKKQPSKLKVKDLLNYPENSIGLSLGNFLYSNGFELLEKSEQHDVFHILTDYGTNISNEMAMQFFLLGNGKRSLYLFGVLFMAVITHPDYWGFFYNAYKRGKSALPFHDLPYVELLANDLTEHKNKYHITENI